MAKVRLLQSMRSTLRDRAREWVACPREQEALDRAYARALKFVLAAVEKRFPPEDTKILKRYDFAWLCGKVYVTGGFPTKEFDLRDADRPLTPYGDSTPTLLVSEAAGEAVAAWESADEQLTAARDLKIKDLGTLIAGSVYLEEVEEVWPVAAEMRDRILAGVPAAVTAEAVERIRAEVAARSKETR